MGCTCYYIKYKQTFCILTRAACPLEVKEAAEGKGTRPRKTGTIA